MGIARTHPDGFTHLFAHPLLVDSLIRVLFTWAEVHPGIDYFQGLNEIVIPLYLVFLTSNFGRLSDSNDEFKLNSGWKYE